MTECTIEFRSKNDGGSILHTIQKETINTERLEDALEYAAATAPDKTEEFSISYRINNWENSYRRYTFPAVMMIDEKIIDIDPLNHLRSMVKSGEIQGSLMTVVKQFLKVADQPQEQLDVLWADQEASDIVKIIKAMREGGKLLA